MCLFIIKFSYKKFTFAFVKTCAVLSLLKTLKNAQF